MEAKFKLGEKVSTRKTGPLTTGTIVEIQTVVHYLEHGYSVGDNHRISSVDNWLKLYPNLEEFPIYTIKYDNPQSNLRPDEIFEQSPQLKDWNPLFQTAFINVRPIYRWTYVPEEDLISIDSLVDELSG